MKFELNRVNQKPVRLQPLRPFQELALSTLRQKNHVLMISETGSGKSRVYYEFAKSTAKRTLLFSPLRALSEQHVSELRRYGLRVPDYGSSLNNTLSKINASNLTDASLGRDHDVIVLTPEHLQNENHFAEWVQWKPDFIAVDEAHCLWDWGKEFRLSFNLILNLITEIRPDFSIWGTATMPQMAVSQIANPMMAIGAQMERVGSFSLPKGLSIQIKQRSLSDRLAEIVQTLSELYDKQETALVFTQTRSMSDRLCRLLRNIIPSVARYHSGLSIEEKQNAIIGFKSGKLKVLIATSAFGMGIDLPKVDHVIFMQIPFSILQWVQMMGRTARFGSSGRAITYYDHDDFRQAALFFDKDSEGIRSLMLLRQMLNLKSNEEIIQHLHDYFV